MIKSDTVHWQIILSAMARSEPLSAENIEKLKAELAEDPKNRGYASAASEAEILYLLGAEYTAAEDESKRFIEKDYWPKDEFDNVILQAFCIDRTVKHPLTGADIPVSLLVRLYDERNSDDPFLRDAAVRLPALQSSSIKGVSMKNDGVADALGYLVFKRIVSPDLLAFMTREEAPGWKPEKTEMPRCWQLFGDGVCPSLEEIKAAMGQ